MSDETPPLGVQPIEPATVALSHQQETQARSWANKPSLWLALTVFVGAGLVIATLAWLPALLQPPVADPVAEGEAVNPNTAPGAPPSSNANSVITDKGPKLAPFAASQKQLARQRAEAQLKNFVEQQLELEESMTVGAWGESDFTSALDLAARGDEEFLQEKFEDAIGTYERATEKLNQLIQDGEQRVDTAVQAGLTALDERQPSDALAAFDAALTISPKHPAATKGRERALDLPEVIRLERLARNQELAQQWQAASATYQQILALDPATSGTNEALAAVSQGAQNLQVQQLLSDAFGDLEARRYRQAKGAFEQVLAVAPGNGVATSGLEQIRQETELRHIDRVERAAASAAAAEDWVAATEQYQAALKIDANIAFAKRGLENANAQQRINRVLDRIIANPDKLSSKSLLEDGQRLLGEAQTLSTQGPKLSAKISQVSELLKAYSTPVEVVIRSDAQTQVVLSSVGQLGRFTNKTVSLRPGAYTLIGSRDGCRDVREQITVRPGMQPLDIRCTENLKP